MLRSCALTFLFLAFVLAASGQSASSPVKHTTAKTASQAAASKQPTAILHTTAGDLTCELFSDKAPKAVANFIGLATGTKDWTNPATNKVEHNHPMYDGVIFHRVIPEFMIQGGDPGGTGMGHPVPSFDDELSADLTFDHPGRLAMANSGPNTNSSQFFITEKEVPFLDPCLRDGGCPELQRAKGAGYTIFGQCDAASVELVKKIARMPRGNGDRPNDPVKIQHIEILNAPSAAAKKPDVAHKTVHKAAPSK